MSTGERDGIITDNWHQGCSSYVCKFVDIYLAGVEEGNKAYSTLSQDHTAPRPARCPCLSLGGAAAQPPRPARSASPPHACAPPR